MSHKLHRGVRAHVLDLIWADFLNSSILLCISPYLLKETVLDQLVLPFLAAICSVMQGISNKARIELYLSFSGVKVCIAQ